MSYTKMGTVYQNQSNSKHIESINHLIETKSMIYVYIPILLKNRTKTYSGRLKIDFIDNKFVFKIFNNNSLRLNYSIKVELEQDLLFI